MSHEGLHASDPRIGRALNELADLVRGEYPEATFTVVPAEDDAAIIHLVARVDVEDPEDVANLIMDRMLEMQIEEELPIYFIPLEPPSGSQLCGKHRSVTPALGVRFPSGNAPAPSVR